VKRQKFVSLLVPFEESVQVQRPLDRFPQELRSGQERIVLHKRMYVIRLKQRAKFANGLKHFLSPIPEMLNVVNLDPMRGFDANQLVGNPNGASGGVGHMLPPTSVTRKRWRLYRYLIKQKKILTTFHV
jgi:hypothetical protein